MSSRRSNSILKWSLAGTLVGSWIFGGALLCDAGPFRLPGQSPAKPDSKQMLVEHDQAARVITAHAEQQDSGVITDTPEAAEARIVQNVKSIRLNFLECSWKTVLSSYAEQAGVELVADPKLIPKSRFSRRDRSFYSSADALKVLNKELHQFDLKLVQQGDKLVLADLPSIAPKYRRPTVSSGLVTEHELPESTIPPAFESRKTPRRIAESDNENANGRAVPIATDPGSVPAGRIQLTAATESPAVDPRKATMMSLQVHHRRTKDLANLLYLAFQKNADLLADGPDGLPAIRVYDPIPKTKQAVGKIALAPPKRTHRFTIAMDHTQGRLTIQAPAATARAVATMIRKLDTAVPGQSTVQLFASNHGDKVESFAEMVQKQLTRISQERNRAPSIDNALAFQGGIAQPVDQNGDQQPPPNAPLPDAPNAGQPGDQPPQLERITGGLKGDVSVESVPGLGVLILKGNQKDVDEVIRIIQEIEKLSAGTIPDVHLLMLKNTNSEALATLLTQVYDRLSGRRPGTGPQGAASANQSVTIIPVVKPNAILIVAAEADMDAILKLAEELDQPVDPDAEFQMFRLKSAVAEQVLETIQAFYEERTTGLGARVLAVADVRTNAILVHARPSDLKEVAKLVKELDQTDLASVSRMKIFPLKNAVATETADVLQQTIQSVLNPPGTRTGGTTQQGGNQFGGGNAGAAAGGQGNAALRAVKSTVLQFLSSDGPGERLLQSGILADIRITADGRTNSLVITAPESSMLLMEELIKQLDRQTSTVAEIKVFGLTNSDARSMVTLLEALFANAGNNQNAQDRLGIQVAGAEDASSGLIPLKFSVDARTNSIVAVGAAESLRVVEAILIRLDESEVRQRQSIVFRLKNSPAADVATAVNNFLTSRRDLEQSGDGLVSPFEQIEREVIVVPERISNTLLISATPRYFNEIKDLVVTLDSAPQQVTIQALLVEVTLSNTDEFGVELGLQDSVLFRRSVVDQLTTLQTTNTAPNGVQTTTQNIISQTAIPGFLFNNQQLGNNTSVSPGIVGKQGLTSFSLGRQNGELGYGGLVLAAGSEGVSVLLRALAATQRVDVLSRPQIRTLDNQLAVIQVGQEVPVVNGVTTTGLSVNPQVEVRSAGIILQVVPRISPDGRVVMDVAAERSTYLPEDQGVTIYSDAATGRTIRAPRKEISTARASVAVSNEQTVVLGGMISSSNTSIQRKVPLIGDLPFLGLPFRYNYNQNVKKELLIFLTPRVVKTDADSEYIKQIETARIHFMEQDAEDIHGPIMAAPPGVDPSLIVPPGPPAGSSVPLIDDPTIPTTTVPPEIVVPPAPPSEDESPKLMRRGSIRRAIQPVAMTK